VKTFLSASVTL